MELDPSPAEFTASEEEKPRRPVLLAIARGIRKRCPNCGRGRRMPRYLKVAPNCPSCGEDLSQHRADDAPPYLTIVVVGHIIVPLILFVETRWPLPTMVHMAIWPPLTLILSLTFPSAMKGAVVGPQWALRMHGFDQSGGSQLSDGFETASHEGPDRKA